ncbi:MAG: hypothetical protein RDV48_02755 [Candidatus Eremiobacteraeota bacterium]|nr:hypothetical protein [Candidatus Eremiobacteraeota bacterium]
MRDHVHRQDRLLSLVFVISLVISLGGCGGTQGSEGSLYGRGSENSEAGRGTLMVSCPFAGDSQASSGIYESLQYYLLNVYEKGSTVPLAPEQRVERSSGGLAGVAQFSGLPAGYVTLAVKGFTAEALVNCELSENMLIAGGLPSEVTVKPLHGPAPNGFTMNEMTFTGGTGAVTLDNFSAASEAIVSITYNSEIQKSHEVNLVTTGGSATNQSSAVPVPAKKRSPPPSPSVMEESAIDDMEFTTRKMAEAVEKYGIPGPVSRDMLIRLGKMDRNGSFIKDTVGQKRDIMLWMRVDKLSSPREYITRSCTCYYAGTRCVIYVDDADWSSSIEQSRVDAIGQHFDATTWQKAEELFGPLPELRWGDRLYVIFSSKIAHGAYFDADNEYDKSEVPHSNQLDCVFCDPTLEKENIIPTDRDWQGVVAHEFQHLLRWFRKVYQSGHTVYDTQQNKDSLFLDSPVTEGLSQYFECMVGRGFLYGDDLSRAYRLKTLRDYLSKPQDTTMVAGSNTGYAMGFLMVFYLLDHYGMDSLQRAELPDGKLALRSLEAASGETAAQLFAKFSMALKLAAVPGINPQYAFTSIDLTGATKYYNGQGLFTAWNHATNCNDYSQGVDLKEGGYSYLFESLKTLEWSPQYLRFCNGSGNPLRISLAGFLPTAAGGGTFTVYVLSR